MILGQPLYALDTIDSTSAELRRLALDGAPHGTVVTAREQTAGYGQRGRGWVSAPDCGLYMSILLPMYDHPTQWPFVLGLGVLDGLSAFTGEVRLKWVNDLVARRKKLGGMLVEGVRAGAIAGIGLNLSPQDSPDAVSLADLMDNPAPSAERLRDAVLAGIEARRLAWRAAGFDGIRAAWGAHSVTLGCEVQIVGGGAPWVGRAEGLGPEGELLLRVADGELKKVISGSVRALDGGYC